jgi:hypothetical protein
MGGKAGERLMRRINEEGREHAGVARPADGPEPATAPARKDKIIKAQERKAQCVLKMRDENKRRKKSGGAIDGNKEKRGSTSANEPIPPPKKK